MFEHELKNAFIGEYIENVVCDFTISDCGFTYVGGVGSPSYGRNSSGFYFYKSSGTNLAAARKIPSDVYSQGELIKAELLLNSNQVGGGGGLSVGVDTKCARNYMTDLLCLFGGETTTQTISNAPANTDYTTVIDLKNKQLYMTAQSGTKLTLSNTQISDIKTQWSSGNMNICLLGLRSGGTCYAYIRKATFYIS